VSDPYHLHFATPSESVSLSATKREQSLRAEAWVRPTGLTGLGQKIFGNGVSGGAGLTLKFSSLGDGRLEAHYGDVNYVDEVVSDQPTSYLRLGEPDPAPLHDYGSLPLVVTVVGQPLRGQPGGLPGDADGAISLAEADSVHLHIPDTTVYASGMTAEFWAWMPRSGPDVQVIASQTGVWQLRFDRPNRNLTLETQLSSGGTLALSTSQGVVAGQWLHTSFTLQTTDVSFYVNGTLRGQANLLTDPLAPLSSEICLGCQSFTGRIDEWAFYSKLLSLSRFSAHIDQRERTVCRTDTVFSPNLWYFVSAMASDQTEEVSLFVDGVLSCMAGNQSEAWFSGSPQAWSIGPWQGDVSEFRLYRVTDELNQTQEVLQNFEATRKRYQ
jgi:hypothetical protein